MTFMPPEAEEKSRHREMRWVSLEGKPSLEKMNTVARVIGLKGRTMGKTLVGSFFQPRDHRLPKKIKNKKNKKGDTC